MNKIFKRIGRSFGLLLLFFFIGFFLILAFVLALPLVLLSVPWYVVNGKGILSFFEEQTIGKPVLKKISNES